MTTEERAALLGNELTLAVGDLVGAFEMTDAQREAVGNVLAATLGRVTALAARPVVVAFERIETLERAVGLAPEEP